jgi:hypothetical protein
MEPKPRGKLGVLHRCLKIAPAYANNFRSLGLLSVANCGETSSAGVPRAYSPNRPTFAITADRMVSTCHC